MPRKYLSAMDQGRKINTPLAPTIGHNMHVLQVHVLWVYFHQGDNEYDRSHGTAEDVNTGGSWMIQFVH